MKTLWETLKEYVPIIALAAFGGFTRTMTRKERETPYNIRIAMQEIVIAIFSGLIIHWTLSDFEIGANIKSASIALAGYSARGVLAILHSLFVNRIASLK